MIVWAVEMQLLPLLTLLLAPVTPREVKQTCTRCHELAVVQAQRLSRDEWEDELRKMERMGADIRDWDLMLDYLAKQYGKSRKKTVKQPAGASLNRR